MIHSKRTKARRGRLQGDDLKALRQDCLDRDKGRCIVCAKLVEPTLPQEDDDSFHMAHKRPKGLFGDNIQNVQTECGRCHRAYHALGPSRMKIIPAKDRTL